MSLFNCLSALALALAGLVAVGASGCDSVSPPASAGPVVQFGTSSLLATEGPPTGAGSTVSIPVTLTGSAGQPVTVEVLFALGSSTAVFNADSTVSGTDFTAFGASADGFRKATVTFTGAADETQTVTFRVLQDNVFESAERAVFALQRPTGATLGTTRELTVNIGTPPISAARAGALNSTYTVEGIVTRAFGRNVYIQDETGGIVLFGPLGSRIANAIVSDSIRVGDRVQATGRLVEFQSGPTGAPIPGQGLLELDRLEGAFSGGFSVLSRGNAQPAAQVVTLAQIAASDPARDLYESEIVRVSGLTIDPAGDAVFVAAKNYTVSQTVGGVTTTGVFRSGSVGDTEVIGTPIPTGPITFQGPIGQFRGSSQLTPVKLTDIIRP